MREMGDESPQLHFQLTTELNILFLYFISIDNLTEVGNLL